MSLNQTTSCLTAPPKSDPAAPLAPPAPLALHRCYTVEGPWQHECSGLYLAASNGHVGIVGLLVEHKADVNTADKVRRARTERAGTRRDGVDGGLCCAKRMAVCPLDLSPASLMPQAPFPVSLFPLAPSMSYA